MIDYTQVVGELRDGIVRIICVKGVFVQYGPGLSSYSLPNGNVILIKLEVLIEKGSAAVSCEANRTKTVCRTVEHINSFLLKSIT